jgi:hypothetical protein
VVVRAGAGGAGGRGGCEAALLDGRGLHPPAAFRPRKLRHVKFRDVLSFVLQLPFDVATVAQDAAVNVVQTSADLASFFQGLTPLENCFAAGVAGFLLCGLWSCDPTGGPSKEAQRPPHRWIASHAHLLSSVLARVR